MTRQGEKQAAGAARPSRSWLGRPSRRFRLALPGICLAVLVVRVLILLEAWKVNPLAAVPMQDAAVYWSWAGQIAGGGLVGDEPFFSAPLYPYLLGLIRAAGGGLPAVYGVQVAVHVLSVACIGLLGARRFGPGVGLASAGVFALLTEPAFLTGRVLNCTLQLFLVCVLWARMLAAAERRRTRDWLAVGLLVGLNCLANPPMMLVLALLGPWILWHIGGGWRGVGVGAAAVVAGMAVILPATVHNYLACGEFIPVSAHSGITFYAGNCPGAAGTYHFVSGVTGSRQEQNVTARRLYRQETGRDGTWKEVDRFFLDKGVRYWKSSPGRCVGLVVAKLLWFISGQHYGDTDLPTLEMRSGLSSRLALAPLPVAWLTVPALLGVGAMLRRAKHFAPELMLLGVPLLVVVVFWYSPRYRFPAVPLIVVLAMWVLSQAFGWREGWRRALPAVAALAVSVGLGGVNRMAGWDTPASLAPHLEYSVGWALHQQGRIDEAIERYRRALGLDPKFVQAEYGLCDALLETGRPEEAVERLTARLAADPKDPEACAKLAAALTATGRITEALAHCEAFLRLKPDDAGMHLRCADLAVRQGLAAPAMHHFEQAIRIEPAMAVAHFRKGLLLINLGQFTAGIASLREAQRFEPRQAVYARALAWQLATHPQAPAAERAAALSFALHANDVSGGENPRVLDALAAAYAAAGQFDRAVTTAQQAIELADSSGARQLAAGLRERLRLYQGGEAYLQPVEHLAEWE